MIHLLPNLLTEDECRYLSNKFDIEKVYTASADFQYSGPHISYGFAPSYDFNIYLDKLKSHIIRHNSNINELINTNTYVREYVNNSILEKHIDRTDISVTMSICLESTINKEWPLYAEINGKEYSYNTNVGDAILLFDADKTIHWRDELICNKNERIIQFFLHWKPVQYISKKIKTII